ncbi:uncharacterized protein [Physcomitrium patens]|uniref:Pectinesterase inhibitor domain-containing protein n=1 Tax=Physcomitrium patens TaxID=3218 RepID=A9RI70_PHYPA|nr:uncharacterized protein LOC112275708 [Physcomitrium patens]PNR29114.1 hypothetical protein PHYPA_027806 [Physcomitrium patens]|eukprot:XP_024362075.1 uncharacterized protein LOC112275708 [Physcomitrella patens]
MAKSAAAVVICVLFLGVFMGTPAVASRKMCKGAVSLAIRALCIPTTESLFMKHDGKHSCAYNLTNGDRAVGVAYNLDDDVESRRSELTAVFADYDKVYEGKDCLNTIQISALLTLDAKRALDRAAKSVKSLDDQCCDVMAVFGDIQHSGGKDVYQENAFDDFIEAVSAKKWEKGVELLDRTRWCNDNKDRCDDDKKIISEGCKGTFATGVIAQVTDALKA